MIPNDAECPDQGPQVFRTPRAGAPAPALCFFGFSWGTILAVALWTIANIGAFSDTFKVYAVLVTTAGWMATAAGLPRLERIPIHRLLRHLYSLTRSHRTLALVTLGGVFIAASSLAGAVL